MTRQVINTLNGFRVYGAFTSMMDVNKDGAVTYSNMVEDSKEYAAMYRAYKRFSVK